MKCEKCGRENSSDAYYCSHCGLPFNDLAEEVLLNRYSQKKSNAKHIVLEIILVIALLAGGYYGYKLYQDNKILISQVEEQKQRIEFLQDERKTEKIEFDVPVLNINVDDSYPLSVSFTPENALNKSIEFESSDSNIAEIHGNIVSAKAEGTSIISVIQDGNVFSQCVVNVTHIEPETVEFAEQSYQLKIGRRTPVQVQFQPSNVTDEDITISIDNENIATLQDGELLGVQSGKTIIRLRHNKTGICDVAKVFVSPVTLDSISANLPEILYIGDSIKLQPVFSPDDVTDTKVEWAVSSDCVSVSETGELSAIREGTTTVTCIHTSGKSDSIDITVKPVLASAVDITIPGNIVMGDTVVLTPAFSPENTTNKTVKWSSSDTSIATVEKDGTLKAKQSGAVCITIESPDGVSSSVNIDILPWIEINNNHIYVGDSQVIDYTLNRSDIDIEHLKWASSSSCIQVNDGSIMAVKAGETTLSCKSDTGFTAKVQITVEPVKAQSIEIIAPDNLSEGETISIAAQFSPENTTDQTVKWTSSDSEIATIDSSGKLKTRKIGSVTISAESKDGITTTHKLSVIPWIAIKEINSLTIGASMKVSYTINLQDKDSERLSWYSSSSCVEIKDGVLYGRKEGEATITCKHSSGLRAEFQITVSPVAVENIRMSSIKEVLAGSSTKASVTITPSNASDKTVRWTSSDSSIATVDSNGNIKAYKSGTVTIYATSSNNISCSTILQVKPAPVNQSNGFVMRPSGSCVAPFKINAPLYANCYVAMAKSGSRKMSYSIYVRAGTSVEVDVPLGTYTMYYATGDTWYGENDLFGKDTTQYNKADDIFSFSKNGNYVNGNEVTLYLVSNGNLETEIISEAEFPK